MADRLERIEKTLDEVAKNVQRLAVTRAVTAAKCDEIDGITTHVARNRVLCEKNASDVAWLKKGGIASSCAVGLIALWTAFKSLFGG